MKGLQPDNKERSNVTSNTTSTGEIVNATWYGKWHHGKPMANGEAFDMGDAKIVAHRTLQLGTAVRLTNLSNGKSIHAVVKDRGPCRKDGKRADLDVSHAAAEKLGFIGPDWARIQIEVLSTPRHNRGKKPLNCPYL